MNKKRKLRNYMLDARFQLPFTLLMVGIAAILTAGLGYFWYGQARESSRIVNARSLSAPQNKEECCEMCEIPGATITDADVKKIKEDMATQDRLRLWILVGFGLAISLLLAASGIIMTHKVAGPIYKIQRHMTDISQGRLFPLYGLRKGDQLQAFWSVFASMHGSLRERAKKDLDAVERFISVVEQHADRPEMASLVEDMRKVREDRLAILGDKEDHV